MGVLFGLTEHVADLLLAFCTCLSSLWLGQAFAHPPCVVAAAGTLISVFSMIMSNLALRLADNTQRKQATLSKMVTRICVLAGGRSWSSIVSRGKQSTRQQLPPPVLAAAFQVCTSHGLTMCFSLLPSNYSLS